MKGGARWAALSTEANAVQQLLDEVEWNGRSRAGFVAFGKDGG